MEFSEAIKILKLKPEFSEDELKKAYKIAAKKNHPDLGGSEEMMKVINEAKDALEKYLEDISKNGRNSYKSYNTTSNHNASNQTRYSQTRSSQTTDYTNPNYWSPQGGSGGSGYGGSGRGRQSSVFDGFEEFFRQANAEYKAPPEDKTKYTYKAESKTSNKTSNTGKKSTNRDARVSDINNLEELLSKLIEDTIGEQKSSALINMITRLILGSIFAVLVFFAVHSAITGPSTIGGVWTVLRTAYKLFVPLVLVNIVVISVKKYKEDVVVKPSIKIMHSFNSSGTWLTIYLHGKKVSSFLVSNTNYEGLWEKMQEAWYNISIGTVSGAVSHGEKKEFVKMPNTNWCSHGKKYKFFEFGSTYICIDFMDGPGFIVVNPAGFIVYNGKCVKFLSMDKMTLNVKYTRGTDELSKTAFYNATISSGETGFTVIYSLANNMWSYLIV